VTGEVMDGPPAPAGGVPGRNVPAGGVATPAIPSLQLTA
jgi:hypothetical protein